MSEEVKHPELPDNKNLIEIAQKKRMVFLLQKLHQGSLSPTEIKELKQFEGPHLPPGCVKTQEEVARAFHVSVRTVRYWIRDGMPQTPEKYYDLIEIQVWRDIKKEKDKSPKGKDEDWDTMAKAYRAMLWRLQFQRESGELIRRAEVEVERKARAAAVRRALWAFVNTSAPAIAGMEAREIKKFLVERAKEIFSQFSEEDFHEDKNQEAGQNDLEQGGEGSVETPERDKCE